MPPHRPRAILLVLGCLGFSLGAHAQPTAPEPAEAAEDVGTAAQPAPAPGSAVVCRYCGPPKDPAKPRRDLHWHNHWDRVGWGAAATISVAGAAYITTLLVKPEDDASWTGPVLLDKPIRKGLRLHSRASRETAATFSDVLFFGSIAQPVLLDNLLVTWVGRQSPDVAWQMFVINSQAYALTMSVNAVTKRLVSRERPYGTECGADPEYSADCDGSSRFKSFYSGHAAVTATGAGLVCAHHTQLELYGNNVLDTATCILGITMTAATGALRISSDNHWASDVMLGHLMGYASGYLMPTLLYYKEFRITPEAPHAPEDPNAPPAVTARATVIPMLTPDSFQLQLIGMF